MTETPTGSPPPPRTSKGASFFKKKIVGVPVIYLIGGAVIVLAVYAYRTKASKSGDEDTEADETGDEESDTDTAGNPLPPITGGTVVVAQPNPANVPGTNASIQTNDDWLRAGLTHLLSKGVSPGVAQIALQAYLEGAVLSYAQGGYRDLVIREYGLPPDPPFAVPDNPKPVAAPKPTPPPPVKPPTPLPKVPPNPTPVPKPKPAPKPAPKPKGPAYPGVLIRRGSTGGNVKLVQAKVGTKQDGQFGPLTEAAVKRYQGSHGLKADGIVGPLTWKKMFG